MKNNLIKKMGAQPGDGTNAEQAAVQTDPLGAEIKAKIVSGRHADHTFCAAQTQFALELLQKTVAENGGKNLLISPYSVMQALAMTANGAAGSTRTQMETALGGIPLEMLNEYLYALRTGQLNEKDCKLNTANSIWIRDHAEQIQVLPEFLQLNADYYNADAFLAPFDQGTLSDINNWCNNKTDGMIPQILGEIPAGAVMCLVNAIAFDAKWDTVYESEDIKTGKFTNADGSRKNATLMKSEEWLYLEDAHAVGFLKPYEGERYVFAALLPDEGISVEDYVAGLTAESLLQTLNSPEEVEVRATMPEFHCDYNKELSDILRAMGMTDAFGEADFSKIVKNYPLNIGMVLHKTHIDVDANGTKAAAATAVFMAAMSAPPSMEKPKYKVVRLDRPFVYMILDTETMLPIFMGITNSVD